MDQKREGRIALKFRLHLPNVSKLFELFAGKKRAKTTSPEEGENLKISSLSRVPIMYRHTNSAKYL